MDGYVELAKLLVCHSGHQGRGRIDGQFGSERVQYPEGQFGRRGNLRFGETQVEGFPVRVQVMVDQNFPCIAFLQGNFQAFSTVEGREVQAEDEIRPGKCGTGLFRLLAVGQAAGAVFFREHEVQRGGNGIREKGTDLLAAGT